MSKGAFNSLVDEFGAENKKEYRKYFRIDPTQFDHILSLVASKISKQDTLMRKAIELDLKLGITLRFLATNYLL